MDMNYKNILGSTLLLSLLSTSSFAEGVGASTDLKTWRVTDHSAKIAFKDNTEGEDIFKISVIGSDGESNKKIVSSKGTGKIRIAKIGKLKKGENYVAYVTAYRYDKDHTLQLINQSKPLNFKTKDTGDEFHGKIAIELKTWRVKDTSAVISFNSNIYLGKKDIFDGLADLGIQKGFDGWIDFTNVDTGEVMTLGSQSIVYVPDKDPNKNYYAARLINLKPATTYTIKLVHIQDMTGQLNPSGTITFTTKE